MAEITKTLLLEWKKKQLPDILKRKIDLSLYSKLKPPKVIAITGFRRVGKTFSMLSLINKLLVDYSREEVVYLNFEDERIPLRTDFLTDLLPTIKEIYNQETKYLFLDEIQNIPQWSKWLRRIYDNEQIQIFVSGSSSKMSSREIPTELRGRFLEVNISSLSFKEFLIFKDLEFDFTSVDYLKNEKAKLLKLLMEYITYGGLPEIVLSDGRKLEIAQSYYNTVLRQDIIERYKIENEESLKAAILLLINSKEYSLSKLYNNLKSMHYAIGKATLQKYLKYTESSYFLITVPIFSYKIKDQLQYPRKVYFIDNVFLTALSTKSSLGMGRLYENVVALELSREGNAFYYWKNQEKEEVDFVVKDEKLKQLIQVCFDLSSPDTKKREIRALLKASQELKCNNLLIINQDYDAEEMAEWFGIKRKVKYIPLWKWLLK